MTTTKHRVTHTTDAIPGGCINLYIQEADAPEKKGVVYLRAEGRTLLPGDTVEIQGRIDTPDCLATWKKDVIVVPRQAPETIPK